MSNPEVLYPENFYTYHYDLIPRGLLDELLRTASTFRMKKIGPDGETKVPPGLPDPPPEPPEDTNEPPDARRKAAIRKAARSWLEAADQWRKGNDHFEQQHYADAVAAYEASQMAALRYFRKFYELVLEAGPLVPDRITSLVAQLFRRSGEWSHLWETIQQRRLYRSLPELHGLDWAWFSPDADDLLRQYLGVDPPTDNKSQKTIRQTQLDRPMLILVTVFIPLARAEANRARVQYEAADADLARVLQPFSIATGGLPQFRQIFFTCEFIERPFAQLLRAETLLDQADREHKARTLAADPPAPDVTQFQDLKAAQTYLVIKDVLKVFKDEGAYVSNVETAATKLTTSIGERLAANDTHSQEFQLLGKDIFLPSIKSSSATLPGLDRRRKAHEPLLEFMPSAGQTAMPETNPPNPRVYTALLTATACLEQLKAGFNYLGYLDSYVPPWRFQFLLERARYFAEHAKNAQREYLNFLSNAEREEFQELSASQNVEMEKSNVRIETARVDQALLELQVAQQSARLAKLHQSNAFKSFQDYTEFDEAMDELFDTTGLALITASLNQVSSIPGLGTALDFGVDFVSGGSASKAKERKQAAAQRDLEKHNLQRAAEEAAKAREVALGQMDVAGAGFVVASLQRQAALLRHEMALQSLEFLRNRVLSAEQWYRLVAAIRSVSETYLRYSVELAFLAEQAYEFEADKRLNVIRFDYDLSEVGDFLAADFLMRDLDTLEKDLVVTQRQRQQHVRYILSMAREFPEALQEIRERGITTFSLRLEQLEKRFPGLYNLRIGAIDVLPIALMDSTRFSLELTYLGTSQVRLKAQPDTPPDVPSPSPLNTNDLPVPEGGWLAELQETWPVKLRVTGPETAVFSGLSRQEANAVFAFATTGQRQAFESLGAAAAWQVDFTARENQVVPGTLADLLITFTLSGYHDPELRSAIDLAPRTTTAVTQWLSGRTTFPDALYEFNRSGRMTWKVTRDLLTLTDSLGSVRNVAMLMLREPGQSNYFGRLMSHCEMQIKITSAGDFEMLSEIPQATFTLSDAANPLRLTTQATLPPGAEISWEFGDNSARQSGASQEHSYAKPGKYTVTLRVVRNGRLSEFQSHVVVSRTHNNQLSPPVTAFPILTNEGIVDGHTRVVGTVNTPGADPVIASWRVGKLPGQKGNQAVFDLEPGDYTLSFTAVRPLRACVYSKQRYLLDPSFEFNGLSLATNRRFDLDGNEITGTADNPLVNPFTKHLFDSEVLSPVDEWIIEIPLSNNAFLRSVSTTDVEQYDLSEIQDVVLALEYETTPL